MKLENNLYFFFLSNITTSSFAKILFIILLYSKLFAVISISFSKLIPLDPFSVNIISFPLSYVTFSV